MSLEVKFYPSMGVLKDFHLFSGGPEPFNFPGYEFHIMGVGHRGDDVKRV